MVMSPRFARVAVVLAVTALIPLVACENRSDKINRDLADILANRPPSSSASPTTDPATAPSEGAAPEGATAETTAYSPYSVTRGFHVDQTTNVVRWLRDNPLDPRAPRIRELIADKPMAKWFDSWDGKAREGVNEYVSAAAAENTLPMVVGYNLPFRDCGQYSAGGVGRPEEYRSWSREVAAGIGDRPAILILEPDSLIHLPCLSDRERRERLDLLRDAVEVMRKSAPRTWVYLDGSDGRFTPTSEMADRLFAAGVAGARGYAVNVSNFNTTDAASAYGAEVRDILRSRYGINAGFVVDISRNGAGSDGTWCNPANRRIGGMPKVGGPRGVDALLWVKKPGESDGDCGVALGSASGQFLPDLALSMLGG